MFHPASLTIAPAPTVTKPAAPSRSPFRAEPSKDALLLFRNVRAERHVDLDTSFVLTVFQESTTAHGTTVQMWHVTVWVADPATRQAPQKTT